MEYFFYRIYDLCRQCRRDTRLTANIRRFGSNSKHSRTFVQCTSEYQAVSMSL